MNIIVIDDEKESLTLFVSHIIDNKKFSTTLFSLNIDEALNFVSTNDVEAVFLDIVMPEINGIDLAEKIIKIKKDIKIVFITGYAQNIKDIEKRIGNNLFAFCYKPYDVDSIQSILSKLSDKNNKKIYFETFGHFNLFVNDVLVDFKRSKAKELLALLVDHRGGEVTLEEAITKLWEDKDVKFAKRLYRDALCRLRIVLEKYDIDYILNSKRGRVSLNTKYLNCDLYDFLDGKDYSKFYGEYLRPYDWSTYREGMLANIQSKEKNC